ncbi:hypothetical protein ABZ656_49940, partial [Streptomyces sp. NPDC007095]|uniref:hypothetical protein n=1 Tax=Streptomyces sp. NPDC007095 TaxID=3154482 RepID=UPI00341181CE
DQGTGEARRTAPGSAGDEAVRAVAVRAVAVRTSAVRTAAVRTAAAVGARRNRPGHRWRRQ